MPFYTNVQFKICQEVEEGENYIRNERYYGKLSRSLQLPDGIDQDNIESTYENGVLELFIPKESTNSEELVKNIEIK